MNTFRCSSGGHEHSAEDLGLLPDLSIADTLARLPGVTAQRVRGRSQQVSIRGLGPDFSLALLNGREVVSAGNNRGIEFDQFPSELIGQGLVYKTGDAQLAAIHERLPMVVAPGAPVLIGGSGLPDVTDLHQQANTGAAVMGLMVSFTLEGSGPPGWPNDPPPLPGRTA